MRSLIRKVCAPGILVLLQTAGILRAQSVDVPLRNWTVPAFTQSTAGGIHTLTDVTEPRTFVAVQPCRIVDTRGNGAPIQGGIFTNSTTRTWDLSGICGLPESIAAVSVNFTVVAAAGIPAGSFLLAWPTGQAFPPTAIMTYGPGQILSNAAIVPLGPGDQMNVAVSGSTHIIMDINGYFADRLGNPFNSFGLTNNSGNATAYFTNESTGCSSGCAVDAFSYSTGQGKAISGKMNYLGNNSAGVYGAHALGLTGVSYPPAGVRGESPQLGVLGIGNVVGTSGSVVATGTGAYLAEGYIGYHTATFDYGVYSAGRTGASGTKSFVDPHPTDASKVIRYVSLEGNEPGTYFRGRGRFERGIARVTVPEDFRLVTDAEGLTVQITPIGAMATVGVIRMDLTEILVQSSRDVEFSYLVQGVRKTQMDSPSPIAEGTEFMPKSADATLPAYFSAEQRRRLIQNGTYREDGTVNMDTARRLGWDRTWEQRSRPATQPVEP